MLDEREHERYNRSISSGGKMRKRAKTFKLIVALAVFFGAVMPVRPLYALDEEPQAEVTEVGNWAEFVSAMENGGAVKLKDDVTKTLGDAGATIPSDVEVVLDLDGHTLSLMTEGVRGLINRGKLTVTGNGVVNNGTEKNDAWGLIDNYGQLVVENGEFVDFGEGGGAALKNRPTGTMTIWSGSIRGYGEAAGNACLYSEGILMVGDGVKMQNDATDQKKDGYYGAYPVIIADGEAVFGETVGAIENPIEVTGKRGGLSTNGGTVTVKNGIYNGDKYYGYWITNDDGLTDVQIEYGEFNGKMYGLRAGVDDGKQDASDAYIEIRGGKFYGETKAAASLNNSGSVRDWGLEISGGEFSSLINENYVIEDYTVYETYDENYPYVVAEKAQADFPEAIYMPEGGSYDISGLMNESAKKYGAFALDGLGDDATYDDWVITDVEVGEGVFAYNFTDAYRQSDYGSVPVIVYKAVNPDDNVSDEDADTTRSDAQEIIDAIMSDKATGDGFSYAEGVTADDVKEAVVQGNMITTKIEANEVKVEDVEGEVATKIDEEVAEMDESAVVAGYYDIDIALLATKGSDITTLGYLTELSDEVVVTVAMPEDLTVVDEGYVRNYFVVRYHNGVTERIPAVDNGDGTFSFKSGLFSTYALAYVDIASDVEPEGPSEDGGENGAVEEDSETTAPDTGVYTADDTIGARISRLSSMMFWMIVTFGAALGARKMQLRRWGKQRRSCKRS